MDGFPRTPITRLIVILWVLLVSTSGTVSAHEVGGTRFDTPIPLTVLFAGAALAVAVTAGWLAVSNRTETPSGFSLRIGSFSGSLASWVRYAGRVLFLFAFLLVLVFGIFGPQVAAENFATVFVWPIWLKGVAVVSVLVGSPWRVLSPWRTLYDGLVQLEGSEIAVIRKYPSWLEEWPALVGFVVWIGVIENLTAVPRSPRATTLLIAGYAIIMLLGAIAFGEDWLDRADALGVLYGLFGRVAPVRVRRSSSGDYAVTLRPPWQGCSHPVRDVALVVFVVTSVYTVSFDGFASTPEYQAAVVEVSNAVGYGLSTGVLLYLAGLGVFVGSFIVIVKFADAMGNRADVRGALRSFAPTVLPIAVAYEIAHNYPFIARNVGQVVFVLGKYVVADPVALDPLAWLSLPIFWGSQVLLIVVGHVIAVVAAHLVTLEGYPTRRLASRAHVPLTVLMVGYTVLSLWIISRPIVS